MSLHNPVGILLALQNFSAGLTMTSGMLCNKLSSIPKGV